MKKVFFLSMMLLVACLASKAFAFDESTWDLEERIYLGEFSLGKADLTSEMNRGILRLGGLPNGRFVRVSVRTNRAGDVDLNTQLVEKREQTVISALRRIIPVSKLSEANVEVFTGRYDQDGVDAQGTWIEVYKPRAVTHRVSPIDDSGIITFADGKPRNLTNLIIDVSMVIFFGACVIIALFAIYVKLKEQVSTHSRLKINKNRLKLLPVDETNQCGPLDAVVKATFDFGDVRVFAWARSDENGRMYAFHDGGNGRYFSKNNRKWQKSVYTTLQNWLHGKDVDGDNQPHSINYLLEAIKKGQVTRVA